MLFWHQDYGVLARYCGSWYVYHYIFLVCIVLVEMYGRLIARKKTIYLQAIPVKVALYSIIFG